MNEPELSEAQWLALHEWIRDGGPIPRILLRNPNPRPIHEPRDVCVLLSEAVYFRAESSNLGCLVASLNHEAAILADSLAPELPYPTDEPCPDLHELAR